MSAKNFLEGQVTEERQRRIMWIAAYYFVSTAIAITILVGLWLVVTSTFENLPLAIGLGALGVGVFVTAMDSIARNQSYFVNEVRPMKLARELLLESFPLDAIRMLAQDDKVRERLVDTDAVMRVQRNVKRRFRHNIKNLSLPIKLLQKSDPGDDVAPAYTDLDILDVQKAIADVGESPADVFERLLSQRLWLFKQVYFAANDQDKHSMREIAIEAEIMLGTLYKSLIQLLFLERSIKNAGGQAEKADQWFKSLGKTIESTQLETLEQSVVLSLGQAQDLRDLYHAALTTFVETAMAFRLRCNEREIHVATMTISGYKARVSREEIQEGIEKIADNRVGLETVFKANSAQMTM